MTAAARQPLVPALTPDRLAALDAVQRRVLWLAALMVHHANSVRPNADGAKVGGHQASSASMVTILTALYFHFLRPGDRVAVKPHAAPALHAAQYLMGRLPRAYLSELRAYGGLQAYPSRTKDPGGYVDFSTGSVGLGAVAPAFAALAQQYARAHFGHVTSERFIALLGDAELDEGSVWEAVLDEALEGLENLIWIVDLNRQSLDRVIPGIRADRLKRLFAGNGWLVLEAKYGRALQALFARPGGDELRRRIDQMPNEEYQALIRAPGPELRRRLCDAPGYDAGRIALAVSETPDDALPGVIANLGGHDLEELIEVLGKAGSKPASPTIIFAYTIKGWGLPIAGHPLNHSMLLSAEQIEQLRETLGVAPGHEWDAFPPDTPQGRLCAEASERLYERGSGARDSRPAAPPPPAVPDDLGISAPDTTSTQEAFGRALVRLADVAGLRERIVTASPDVAVSTNLAGWINKMGVFTREAHPDYETEAYRLLRWARGPAGRHIELGISEMNLFMLLAMLGLSDELHGQPLIPVGTVYDPFVCRGLDALIYGVYSGARFIVAGTPSGVTLSPEGGAHQSTITPSIGAELPGLAMYEPCYARELEWALLAALRSCLDREHGRASYMRLSTKPVDQRPFGAALARAGEAELRRQALAGGYRLLDWRDAAPDADPRYAVTIAAAGVMVPEALAAAAYLHREGVAASVLCLPSPRALYEGWQADQAAGRPPLSWLIPADERRAPIITVQDGASHSLAWLGGVYGAPITALGVDSFGQSGARAELYRHFGIDAAGIAEAAFAALDAFV